jgi:hypothetical protein
MDLPETVRAGLFTHHQKSSCLRNPAGRSFKLTHDFPGKKKKFAQVLIALRSYSKFNPYLQQQLCH